MKYITIPEWAELIGVSKGYAYSLVRDKKVRGVRYTEGTLMIRADAVPKVSKKPEGRLAGKKVGNILIVESTGKKQGTQYIYKCRCLLCGKEFETVGTTVMRGQITNCGCQKAKQVKENLKKDMADGTRPSLLTARVGSNNTSGHKGVSKKGDIWVAYLDFKGKRYHLGRYGGIESAIAAREQAEQEIFAPYLQGLKCAQEPKQDIADISPDEYARQRGVYFADGNWRVIIVKGYKSYFIGNYRSFFEAKEAYDTASKIDTEEGLSAYVKNSRRIRKSQTKTKKIRSCVQDHAIEGRKSKYYYHIVNNGIPLYRVVRRIDGVRVHIGDFNTLEDALPISEMARQCVSAEDLKELKALIMKRRKEKTHG